MIAQRRYLELGLSAMICTWTQKSRDKDLGDVFCQVRLPIWVGCKGNIEWLKAGLVIIYFNALIYIAILFSVRAFAQMIPDSKWRNCDAGRCNQVVEFHRLKWTATTMKLFHYSSLTLSQSVQVKKLSVCEPLHFYLISPTQSTYGFAFQIISS